MGCATSAGPRTSTSSRPRAPRRVGPPSWASRSRTSTKLWRTCGPADLRARGLEFESFDLGDLAGSTVTLPITHGVPIWQTNLTGNAVRGDCLLLYAGGGPELADLHARLIGPDGQPQGADVVVASATRGPIGAGASGDGYAFAYNQDGVSAPTGAHVIVGRLTGSPPRVATVADRMLAGQAQFAVAPGPATGLLAWRPQVDHPSWFQIRGELVH